MCKYGGEVINPTRRLVLSSPPAIAHPSQQHLKSPKHPFRRVQFRDRGITLQDWITQANRCLPFSPSHFPSIFGASIATIAFGLTERASKRYSSRRSSSSLENDGTRYITCFLPLFFSSKTMNQTIICSHHMVPRSRISLIS